MERSRESEILDDMYDFEEEYDLQEKEDEQYFIGIYICMKDNQWFHTEEENRKLYLGMTVSAKLFFKYEYKYVQKYLCSAIRYCPHARNYHLKVSIMKLNITDDGLCLVIVKTYWLKLIQRHWKTVMKIRNNIIRNKMKYEYLKGRELGKQSIEKIPKLRGMLYLYSKKKH